MVNPGNKPFFGVGVRDIFLRFVIASNFRILGSWTSELKAAAPANNNIKSLFGNSIVGTHQKGFKRLGFTNGTRIYSFHMGFTWNKVTSF